MNDKADVMKAKVIGRERERERESACLLKRETYLSYS